MQHANTSLAHTWWVCAHGRSKRLPNSANSCTFSSYSGSDLTLFIRPTKRVFSRPVIFGEHLFEGNRPRHGFIAKLALSGYSLFASIRKRVRSPAPFLPKIDVVFRRNKIQILKHIEGPFYWGNSLLDSQFYHRDNTFFHVMWYIERSEEKNYSNFN